MILRFLRHHRFTFVALALCAVLVGCAILQPRTSSPSDPKLKVTKAQLDAEVAIFQTKAKAAYADLQRQQTIINSIGDAVASVIPAIPGPWAGVASVAGGLLASGFGFDSLRRNKIIKQLKGETPAPAPLPAK